MVLCAGRALPPSASSSPALPQHLDDDDRLRYRLMAARAGRSSKKGANPLKAKLRAPAAGPAGDVDVGVEDDSAGPSFEAQLSPPLVTLLFSSKAKQHRALARIEAFYESAQSSRSYLALQEAKQAKLCQHYEAFNFPLSVVREWMEEMRSREMKGQIQQEDSDADKAGQAQAQWWSSFVNTEETDLLALLHEQGALPASQPSPSPAPLSYLISTLLTQSTTSLPHERLHALYHLSAPYRSAVSSAYANLSRRTRKAMETDLGMMRGYGEKVWEDEWQAYVVHGEEEIGGGVAKGENGEARVRLREVAMREAREWLGVTVGALW